MKETIFNLETEQSNDQTKTIDTLFTWEILQMINKEDQSVAYAVEKEIPSITLLVDQIVNALNHGGRLFYIGAGTSGRLGFLDAAECPPTFGVSYELIQGIMAGGYSALYKAKEGSEDDSQLGRDDLKDHQLTNKDVVIGIAASGRTPYVIGALEYANEIGAYTGSIACVSNSVIGTIVKRKIEVITGQEVITGSTRMKAGTAQKLILNMISTAVMIRLGKVYGNLMVDVMPTNEKLVKRAVHIIQQSVECSDVKAQELFELSDGNAKVAIVMGLTTLSKVQAVEKLEEHHGKIRTLIESL